MRDLVLRRWHHCSAINDQFLAVIVMVPRVVVTRLPSRLGIVDGDMDRFLPLNLQVHPPSSATADAANYEDNEEETDNSSDDLSDNSTCDSTVVIARALAVDATAIKTAALEVA